MIGCTGGGEGRGFGQAIKLDEIPAQFRLEPFDEGSGGRRTGHGEAWLRSDLEIRLVGEVEDGSQHRRRHAGEGDPFVGDQLKDAAVLDGAQDHMGSPHAGQCVDASPSVAVEHGQSPEFDIVMTDTQVRDQAIGVDVEVAVGEHHALGARSGARRVVDRDHLVLPHLDGGGRRRVGLGKQGFPILPAFRLG